MEIRARHWLVAISAASIVHMAVVAGIRDEPRPPPPPAPIIIQLGESGAPEGAAGGGPAATTEPAGAPLAPVAAALPLPALAASEAIKAPVVEPPRPKVEPPKPKPKPKSKPKPPPKQAATPKPRTQSTRPSRPSTAASSRAQSQHTPRAGASGRTTGTRASGSGQGSGQTGSGRGAGGSGSAKGSGSGANGTANYYGKLAAWLNRHKRYPSRARRLRQEGTVKVSFTINRSGRVLSHRIVSSSGHTLLDQEVEAMLKRASPLPAFPSGMSQSPLTITVPIRFNLR